MTAATALGDVRLLDLTRVWSGPLAARILGDLGAHVIKIEQPSARGPAPASLATRDEPRAPGVLPGPDPWNLSGQFNKLHRNKQGVTLDLAKPGGHAAFCRLVQSADVVLENYSPRVMGNLGLDYATLCRLNPSLIMVSMPGYGLDGPWRDRVAYGTTLDAETGLATLAGYPDRGPRRTGATMPDLVAAVHAVDATLTALWQRDVAGAGQHVDLSQFESMINFVGDQVVAYQLTGRLPSLPGNRHRWMAPHGVYPCREPDTWLSIAVASDQQWQALTRVIDAVDLTKDARLATVAGRLAHQDEIDAVIRRWTHAHEAREAMRTLQSAGITAGAVLDARGMLEDPHLRARGFFVSLEHPSAGRHDYPGLPIKLSRTPSVFRSDAPRLGEHNRTVLHDLLGYDEETIQALVANNTIADRPPPA